ncbi:MAG: 4Fe-4S dicluster domain-containing protein, partial [Bacteroidetes bacterium]|nr:4Fe-4S dicluster domain-containing protein [Bacteroidota bacterium]
MKYGFIIDNRKCIGCHACTTACKSEHDVPVGVFRTWVKQVEKGEFPNTRRVFSVMRCNHCTDAPCVEICPVEALYFRPDGIVDFDKNRCIGCKSCMQACPYDALYIDPDTHTAAKCNYCAHRVDIGLEPACVNVCPEHAIISGDMDNPETKISQLLGREQVTVRKAAKGTVPNLFYIDGDEASLNPIATEKPSITLWGAQTRGVGHFAKQTEKLAYDGDSLITALADGITTSVQDLKENGPQKSIDVLMNGSVRNPNSETRNTNRVYDAPDKGLLWGWEVSAYVWTKAIATGAFLVPFIAAITSWAVIDETTQWLGIALGLVFLGLTGALLVKDLDRPDRFLNVLLRPQWKSWLAKGGYAIAIYGLSLTLLGVSMIFDLEPLMDFALWSAAIFAVLVAVYTAFLFAQAKGRDFWQSPALALHMLIHSLLAGAAVFAFTGLVSN